MLSYISTEEQYDVFKHALSIRVRLLIAEFE